MAANDNEILSPGGGEDPAILSVATRALEFAFNGARIGLGSGRAAQVFIKALGDKVRGGLKVHGVPTSLNSEKLAIESGIPLIELSEDVELDFTIDGADEVTPDLDLVKGWGGALVRERIVAAASKRQIILAGAEKRVNSLGEKKRIPVEVIPIALGLVSRKLKALGFTPTQRLVNGKPFVTDNGNLTLDCAPATPIVGTAAALAAERAILAITGVVDTGLFIGTAERVLIGHADGRIEELIRQ